MVFLLDSKITLSCIEILVCTFGQCHGKRICKKHINTVTLTQYLFTYIVIAINVSNEHRIKMIM